MASTAYRSVFQTSNNPQKYYLWAAEFDYKTASPEDFERLLQASIEPFIRGQNGKDRDPEKNGILAVAEIGKQGTFHLHHLFCSTSPIRLNSHQKKYPHSDIEPVRGTLVDVSDYVYKQGKHSDKRETQLCAVHKWGKCFTDNKGSSSTPIFSEIETLLEQGLRPRDLYELSPKYALYRAAIEETYTARKTREIPLKRKLSVTWHVGASGTGKSSVYYALCKKLTPDEVYFISGKYKNIWDMYSYESCIFLDDFRSYSMPLTELLSICDIFPLTLKCRYADRKAAFTEIHITSVYPPEEVYSSLAGFDTIQQLLRRLSCVVFHYKNTALSGDDQYQQIQIPAVNYKNYRQLETLASQKIMDAINSFRLFE